MKQHGVQSRRERVSASIDVLTANATTYYGIMAVTRSIRVKAIYIVFTVKPASALGTVLANVYNYDVSATADDQLNETADFDLETITNKVAAEIAEQTTTVANLNDIDAGDYLFLKVVSNHADMTDGSGGVITIEYETVPS